MEIMQINRNHVRLSDHTITVFGENGKTCGLVRANRISKLPPRDIFNLHKKINNIRKVGEFDNLYLYNGEVFYIRNINSDPYMNNYGFEEYNETVKRIIDTCSADGIQIIEVKL